MNGTIDKVVLAYSGGLDTSVILRWLKDHYRCDIVTFTADIGQGEHVDDAFARRQCPVVVEDDGCGCHAARLSWRRRSR